MHVLYHDFLGGKVKLKQPNKGFKGTSDSVLLALFSGVKKGGSVLDVGCGTGVILACLPASDLKMTGIDIQPDLIFLAGENLPNGVFYAADIADYKMTQTFDLVITNPPYFKDTAPTTARKLARHETVSLAKWIDFCVKRVKPKGKFACILPAERMGEALSLLNGRMGAIEVLPVFSTGKSVSAHAIILTAVLNSKKPLVLKPPIYTDSRVIQDRLRGKR